MALYYYYYYCYHHCNYYFYYYCCYDAFATTATTATTPTTTGSPLTPKLKLLGYTGFDNRLETMSVVLKWPGAILCLQQSPRCFVCLCACDWGIRVWVEGEAIFDIGLNTRSRDAPTLNKPFTSQPGVPSTKAHTHRCEDVSDPANLIHRQKVLLQLLDINLASVVMRV